MSRDASVWEWSAGTSASLDHGRGVSSPRVRWSGRARRWRGLGRGIVLLIFFAGIARGGQSIIGAASGEVAVHHVVGCRVSMVMVMVVMVEDRGCSLQLANLRRTAVGVENSTAQAAPCASLHGLQI